MELNLSPLQNWTYHPIDAPDTPRNNRKRRLSGTLLGDDYDILKQRHLHAASKGTGEPRRASICGSQAPGGCNKPEALTEASSISKTGWWSTQVPLSQNTGPANVEVLHDAVSRTLRRSGSFVEAGRHFVMLLHLLEQAFLGDVKIRAKRHDPLAADPDAATRRRLHRLLRKLCEHGARLTSRGGMDVGAFTETMTVTINFVPRTSSISV